MLNVKNYSTSTQSTWLEKVWRKCTSIPSKPSWALSNPGSLLLPQGRQPPSWTLYLSLSCFFLYSFTIHMYTPNRLFNFECFGTLYKLNLCFILLYLAFSHSKLSHSWDLFMMLHVAIIPFYCCMVTIKNTLSLFIYLLIL